jgi:hypothetical protein
VLDLLLMHRFGIARLLQIGVAVGLSSYLAVFHGWPWWAWSLTGIACLLFVPVLWGVFLGVFELRRL